MSWLREFKDAANRSDRFADHPQHMELLGAGLLGETGSVLTELKKEQRERDAYPAPSSSICWGWGATLLLRTWNRGG